MWAGLCRSPGLCLSLPDLFLKLQETGVYIRMKVQQQQESLKPRFSLIIATSFYFPKFFYLFFCLFFILWLFKAECEFGFELFQSLSLTPASQSRNKVVLPASWNNQRKHLRPPQLKLAELIILILTRKTYKSKQFGNNSCAQAKEQRLKWKEA